MSWKGHTLEMAAVLTTVGVAVGGATAALAAGVSPQLIRLMGRWSSDVYEIYCRMSASSALGVGLAISSAASVQPLAEAFHEEHFELLESELDTFRRSGFSLAADEMEEQA